MKTNIKLRVTPEQSEAVQKICFANGAEWLTFNSTVSFTDKEYLFIDSNIIWYRGITDHNSDMETVGYTEVDADLFIRTNGTCEESINIVDNSSNNKSKEDMFKQYGFEVPDFDCTILAKVNDKYIGYVTMSQGEIYPTYWYANGCRHIDEGNHWNLTPIKKPWYEICKYPVLVWDTFADKLEVATEYTNNVLYLLSDIRDFSEVRPLTNAEIDQLKQDF